MKKIIILALVSLFSLSILAQNNDNVLIWAETMPEYPGGSDALRTYIAQNVVYPQAAVDDNISGTVYVRFVVSKTGEVINPVVMRGADPLLDAAALDVCETIPNFTPGQQNG
ncbi:MAG: TonB family protein [Bacteroidales bacterium]|nr:TonB family protein [Bacteroidales bacterium]